MEPVHVERPAERRAAPERPSRVPLWLTEREAEHLLALCAASHPKDPGVDEEALIRKLAECVRLLHRQGPA